MSQRERERAGARERGRGQCKAWWRVTVNMEGPWTGMDELQKHEDRESAERARGNKPEKKWELAKLNVPPAALITMATLQVKPHPCPLHLTRPPPLQ